MLHAVSILQAVRILNDNVKKAERDIHKKQSETHKHPPSLFVCIIITSILMCGWGCLADELQARSIFQEANDFFRQGDFQASLNTYQQILEKHPMEGDRILFQMGIIYSYPANEQKDYQKSLECFQKLIENYPESRYKRDSEMMIFNINNVVMKDKAIDRQKTQIESLQQRVRSREDEITALKKEIKVLEQKIFALRKEPADKVLIEKRERRLTLLSKGEILKTYKIALGGNPIGPKERQGDSKTPEGVYIIDSRNRNSQYHLSLRISYPNEKDKKRAKELGVSPGGDIMIHGIKNGLSWVGDLHTGVDWTKGCIAVSDEEIEEIDRLVPIGTIVEIRP